MRLTPRQPPGRLNRKALSSEPEICRLHLEGHTSEAIRQALLDAGLSVSRSTVQRVVARHAKRRLPREVSAAAISLVPKQTAAPAPAPAPAPTPIPSLAFAGDPRSSKEIAEAFVKGRITNSLLRSRIQS